MFKKRKPDHISQEDWDSVDSPPLTKEELKKMRPAREVDTEFLARWAEEKKRRGRPEGRTKEAVRISLDRDVVEALRASGAGWQTRANEVLRKALKLPDKPARV
jgi:uncharacterized protein (DUF4415 family)